MKKVIPAVAILCALTVTLVVSCSKNYHRGDPDPVLGEEASYVDLNKVFSALRSTPQHFTVQAGVETEIVGAQGTRMLFYENSFRDAAGNTITSGTINIDLVEMYKAGDMIANRAPTMTSSGDMLESGGEIDITATKDGKEVFTNGYGLSFKAAAVDSQQMQLFFANTNNEDSVLVWTMADTSSRTFRMSHRQGQKANGTTCTGVQCLYVFDTCTKFRKINCDRFSSIPNNQKTDIAVILPDTSFITNRMSVNGRYARAINTEVYLVFPTINSCMKLGEYGSYRARRITDTVLTDQKVPIGWPYKVAIVTYKDGKYYYWDEDGTITTNMAVKTSKVEVTTDVIKVKLNAL